MTSTSVARDGRVFRVGRSRTGLGLFATAPIPKGTVIVEYTGKRITSEEADSSESRRQNRYLFELDENWTIDGSARSNLGRYVNHACRPNTDTVNDGERIFFEAKRLIRPGEEITCHYGKTYLEVFFGPNGCRCTRCVPGEKPAAATSARRAASPRSRRTRSDAASRS